MPHLGDDAPLWPLIGCRRGPLRDALPVQVLCPALRREPKIEEMEEDYQPRRSLDIADRCLLMAESQRLADMKAVLECASYELSISDPAARRSFVNWVETGRYRNKECLHKSLIVEDEPVTYTEMIAIIAWELAENQAIMPLLEMRSWDEFVNMLETACIYESEVGQVRVVGPFAATLTDFLFFLFDFPDITRDAIHGLSATLPRSSTPVLGWSPC